FDVVGFIAHGSPRDCRREASFRGCPEGSNKPVSYRSGACSSRSPLSRLQAGFEQSGGHFPHDLPHLVVGGMERRPGPAAAPFHGVGDDLGLAPVDQVPASRNPTTTTRSFAPSSVRWRRSGPVTATWQ